MAMLYRKEEYGAVLQQCDVLHLEPLSAKELFFVSSAVLKSESLRAFCDPIELELLRRFQHNALDSFGLYNLGLFWKLKNDTRAITAFLASIHDFPYFWSCWLELSSLLLSSASPDTSCSAVRSQCILKNFFQLQTTNRLFQVAAEATLDSSPTRSSRSSPRCRPSSPAPPTFSCSWRSTTTATRVDM